MCCSAGDGTVALASMSPDASYSCWTVHCPGCETLIFLDIIGPIAQYKLPVVPKCREFVLTCSECGTEHVYSSVDVKDEILLNPPIGTRRREFIEAIVRSHPPDR